MATNETVNIWVKVKGGAAKALKGVSSQLKKNDAQVKKNAISWKKLAGAAGGLVVLTKVSAWMKENARLAQEQEKATARLTSIAKNVTKATDEQILSMQKLADEYQRVTTFGDEVLETGMSQLLSFGATTDQVEELTGSFTDLLAANKGVNATSQDAIDTANMLGKALSGQAGALSRVGILMDERQTKLIQEGDAATRVSTLVEIMDANYGGLAETLAQTDAGQIAQMENEIGDLREELGEKLLPAMVDVKKATVTFYEAVGDEDGFLFKSIGYMADLAKQTSEVVRWMSGGKKEWADAADATWRFNQSMNAQNDIILKQSQRKIDNTKETRKGIFYSNEAVREAEKKILKAIEEQERLRELQKAYKEKIRLEREEVATTPAVVDGRKKKAKATDDETEAIKKYKVEISEPIEALKINRDNVGDALEEERLIHEQRFTMAVDFAQQTANQVTAIMSAVSNSRQQELENDTKRQKEDVKNSTMSAKQKAKALGKIDEDQAKKQHELRLKEWRQNLIMSIVNTALAISKTIAVMGGTPAAIPFVIAAGLTGAVSTGIIAANKPKMFNGGELTDPSGMKGDVIPFVGRAGETVVTPEEKKNSGGGGNTVSIGAPQIIIQGDATPSAIAEIREIFDNFPRAIEDAFRDKLVNADIINGALSI